MQHQNLQHILCSDAHEGGIFFLKRSKNTQNTRWRHVYVEIQDGRYFGKIVYVFTVPQMYRSFESIKNLQRFLFFFKLFVIPGRNALSKKSNRGIFLPPFQIEVGGAKEHPPPLG